MKNSPLSSEKSEINQRMSKLIFCDNPGFVGNIPIDHVSIEHQSQQSISRDFPLFKLWIWFVSNRAGCPRVHLDMVRLPTTTYSDWGLEFFPWINQSDIFILNWLINSDMSNCSLPIEHHPLNHISKSIFFLLVLID